MFHFSQKLFLAEEAKKKELTTKKRQREETLSELDHLKAKKKRIEDDVALLIASADKKAIQSENAQSHALLVESNALRLSAKEKGHNLEKLSETIQKKKKEFDDLCTDTQS